MLFAIKNHWLYSFLLLVILVWVAVALRDRLGVIWSLDYQPQFLPCLLAGMVLIAVSDAGLHGLFVWLFGERYRWRYRALVEYFRPQGWLAIIMGSLLAGGEELVFRGLLLEGLRTLAGFSSSTAVGLSALLFGFLHLIPRRPLQPFALWAVWEGVVLGGVYVWSGSLLVNIVLHVWHDFGGFSIFARQRHTGWLMGG
jgi:membrane protease YdiL (CAAX protease family)